MKVKPLAHPEDVRDLPFDVRREVTKALLLLQEQPDLGKRLAPLKPHQRHRGDLSQLRALPVPRQAYEDEVRIVYAIEDDGIEVVAIGPRLASTCYRLAAERLYPTEPPRQKRREYRRREEGQVIVWMTLAMVMLLALGAFVIDVGSWYVAKRKLVACADAATLAGAQGLPSPPDAVDLGEQYQQANCPEADVVWMHPLSVNHADDAFEVKLRYQAPAYFARIVGIASATLHAEAEATRTPVWTSTRPNGRGLAVPDFAFKYGSQVWLDAHSTLRALRFNDAPDTGAALSLFLRGDYPDPIDSESNAAKMSASVFDTPPVRSALRDRIGTVLVLAVYKEPTILGWAAFRLDAVSIVPGSTCARGGDCQIRGQFLSSLEPGAGDPAATDYGAEHIELVR